MPIDPAAFLRGAGIGAAIAAPVGPMCVLCMRRTFVQGWRTGFATGIGIAAGDGIYALVAALGLAGVMRFVAAYERPLHLAAGIVLLYLGWRAFVTPVTEGESAAPIAMRPAAAFASSLLLTLTNPPTIVSFVAVFTVLVPTGFDVRGSLVMVAGVFSGSLLWWLFVTLAVSAARRTLGTRARRMIDRLAGAILGLLGAAELRRAA